MGDRREGTDRMEMGEEREGREEGKKKKKKQKGRAEMGE